MITLVSWDEYQAESQSDSKPIANPSQSDSKPLASTKEREEGKNAKEVLPQPEKFDITVEADFDKVYDHKFFEWLKMARGWEMSKAKKALRNFADYKAGRKEEIDTAKALRSAAKVYLNYPNIKEQFK